VRLTHTTSAIAEAKTVLRFRFRLELCRLFVIGRFLPEPVSQETDRVEISLIDLRAPILIESNPDAFNEYLQDTSVGIGACFE